MLAHLDAGQPLSEWPGSCPTELEPLTTKPLLAIENGPGGIDCKLEAELAELPEDEAAAFRDGPSALDEVVRRLQDALGLIAFFTAGDKETRAWTLRNGQTALDAAGTIHSDIARGFIRCEVIRWDDLLEAGSHAEAREARPGAARGEDVRRRGRRRPQHQRQLRRFWHEEHLRAVRARSSSRRCSGRTRPESAPRAGASPSSRCSAPA